MFPRVFITPYNFLSLFKKDLIKVRKALQQRLVTFSIRETAEMCPLLYHSYDITIQYNIITAFS